MKEQKITRTIEEINGYIADDGTWFKTKEECQKYEESAKMVVYNMIKDKIVGTTTHYDLLGEGCEDCDVEIYLVDSIKTVELLNRYISLSTYDKKVDLITIDMVGQKVIVFWSYDKDWCYCKGTIEELLCDIKSNYEKVINKTKTN